MPIFKYTVANKEGKKLSGTVEAPDEITARTELNNLGFSILLLQETKELPAIDTEFTKFIFEAIDKNSKLINGSIPAKTEDEAVFKLYNEYELNVSAIWKDGASPEETETAKKIGQTKFQNKLQTTKTPLPFSVPILPTKTPEQEKKEQFVKEKIENILVSVNKLLKNFEQDLNPDQKAEINKKIDKLLRIKHSTNLDYILETANELLSFLENQEKLLKETALKEERFEFKVQTQKLLSELNRGEHQKSFSEDIIGKIENWQNAHTANAPEASTGTKIINSILNPIKEFFTTQPEILAIKEQIKAYNHQIWEFIKLYFKEPTPEYKKRVKNSIKAIWQARKKAKENLKTLKAELKAQREAGKIEEHLVMSFVEELNALTGWLLTFYIAYYFISLYFNTKYLGFSEVPKGFNVYTSQIFKYLLVTIFLLHATTSIKINFLRNNLIASFILPPIFIFGTIIALLNF